MREDVLLKGRKSHTDTLINTERSTQTDRHQQANPKIYFHYLERKSLIRTHLTKLTLPTPSTHTGAGAECVLPSVRSRADRPQQVEHQGGKSERVDGCLLQTQRPGPSVGEFVMRSLTPDSHLFIVCVLFCQEQIM